LHEETDRLGALKIGLSVVLFDILPVPRRGFEHLLLVDLAISAA